MLKIEISFRNANAAHKASNMLETMTCPVPPLPLVCGFCPYKDACEPLMNLIKVLKEVKDDEE